MAPTALFYELVNQSIGSGDYHIPEIDESTPELDGPNGGTTTRVNIATRGLQASIEYAKNLCLGPKSPFVGFSINPSRNWITLKTVEGRPWNASGWISYVRD